MESYISWNSWLEGAAYCCQHDINSINSTEWKMEVGSRPTSHTWVVAARRLDTDSKEYKSPLEPGYTVPLVHCDIPAWGLGYIPAWKLDYTPAWEPWCRTVLAPGDTALLVFDDIPV